MSTREPEVACPYNGFVRANDPSGISGTVGIAQLERDLIRRLLTEALDEAGADLNKLRGSIREKERAAKAATDAAKAATQAKDAAALDGYGHLRFMTRVAVPLARPMVAALALFSFFAAWNQYLWPLIVTKDDRLRTVQIGLRQLRGESVSDINVTLAGTVLAALPLFILLLVFQKQLVRGLTAGAVKG